MNTKNTVFLLLCSVILFILNIPLLAFADSGSDLTISGNVVAYSCSIAPDTVEGDVDLGKVLSLRLLSAGDSADWSAFSLKLTDCPPTITKVIVHFTGTPDPDYPVYFKNSGSSERVAIEVEDTSGGRISNSSERTLNVDAQQQARIDLKGRIITPQGAATSGSVTGVMELAFDFQ